MSIGTRLSKFQQVNPGDDVREVSRADRVNSLQDLTKSLIGGTQVSGSSQADRVVGPGYSLYRPRGGARFHASGLIHRPWEIKVLLNNVGNWVMRMRPGTINNMLPSNMFYDINVSSFGTYYAVVHVFTDGYKPTRATIDLVNDPPNAPSSNLWLAPFTFDILIGVIVDLKVFQIITDPLQVQPSITIQSLSPNPQPGQPYLENNYTWAVNAA